MLSVAVFYKMFLVTCLFFFFDTEEDNVLLRISSTWLVTPAAVTASMPVSTPSRKTPPTVTLLDRVRLYFLTAFEGTVSHMATCHPSHCTPRHGEGDSFCLVVNRLANFTLANKSSPGANAAHSAKWSKWSISKQLRLLYVQCQWHAQL